MAIFKIIILFVILYLPSQTKVLAGQAPQVHYQVTIDVNKRVIVGKATFKFFEKKLYIISLSKARVISISAMNALHHLQDGTKEYLLSFFPSSSESSLELTFERDFTLRALIEGEYLPSPFPYLTNSPFVFELKIILPHRGGTTSTSGKKPKSLPIPEPLLKAFISSDFFTESIEEGFVSLKFIQKTPVNTLPTLVIGPYEKEEVSAGSLTVNFLTTDKYKNFLFSLKRELKGLVERIAYVSFKFPTIYLAYGFEEEVLPGLILLDVNKEYSPQDIVSLLLEHELSHGRKLPSQTLIKGLALYLGAHEFTPNQVEFRRRLLLSQDERAFSFYSVYEFAQRVGEPVFKITAMEFLSQKLSEKDFLKRYSLEENFPQGEIKVIPPKEIQAKLSTFNEKEKIVAELYLLTNNFRSPYELEVQIAQSKPEERKLKVLSREERITLELPKGPTTIRLDPYYKLYRKLSLEEVPRNLETLTLTPLTVILPDKSLLPLYQPLINLLRDKNSKVRVLYRDDKLDLFLTRENLLFLHQAPSNYFVDLPKRGFYVKFLPHPTSPFNTIALAKAERISELKKALEGYPLWKMAEEAHLIKGEISNIKKDNTQRGILLRSDVVYGLKPQILFSLEEVVPHLLSSRIVLIGEEHTIPGHHQFQLEVIKRIYQKFPKLVIGVEMVQRPFQPLLDDFIKGKISEQDFLRGIEYFDRWGYDWRLYRDIFLWARENKVKMLALDLPREIVEKVHRLGLRALTERETKELPETDFQQPIGYKRYLEDVYSQHRFTGNESNFERFFQAQVLRDEAMAETLSEFLSKNPEYKAIVLVGKGHILNRWGLYYALKKRIKHPILSIILGDVPFFSPEVADYLFHPPEIKFKGTPQLGISLEEVKEGLMVKEVKPGSLAEKMGLKKEDIILEANHKRIQRLSDLRLTLTFLEEGEILSLKVRRGNKEEVLTYNLR